MARFAPSGERGVEARAERRGGERRDRDESARTRQDERQERAYEAADDELPVAAEIQHAAAQRNRGDERHADERRRPVQGVGEAVERQRTLDDLGIGMQRIVAGDEHERPADQR